MQPEPVEPEPVEPEPVEPEPEPEPVIPEPEPEPEPEPIATEPTPEPSAVEGTTATDYEPGYLVDWITTFVGEAPFGLEWLPYVVGVVLLLFLLEFVFDMFRDIGKIFWR